MDIPEDLKPLESDKAKTLEQCEKAMAEQPDVQVGGSLQFGPRVCDGPLRVDQEYAPNHESEPRIASSSIKTPSSPPRRPLTRSQTGTVSKRRPRADSDTEVESKKRPAKRQKTSASPSQVSGASNTGSPSTSSQPPLDQSALEAIGASRGTPPPSPNLTFYHASPASEDQNECRGVPRSRASLPTPIPNLTKKSRGRRVPTKGSTSNDPEQTESRLYVCTVEGCGKCFNRGEHLKRHIRSIHTHEKPFKCTYLHCEKFFNRHDNLLQHLKVHRDPPVAPQTLSAPLRGPGVHYSSSEDQSPRPRSYSPADEPDSPILSTQPRTIYSHIPPPTYHVYSAPIAYAPTSEPMMLMTNMAISSLRTEVSSLRTELPNSPINTQLA